MWFLPDIELSGENPSQQRPFQFAMRNLVAATHEDQKKFLHRAEFRGTYISVATDQKPPQ
jgi:hypothetical protein